MDYEHLPRAARGWRSASGTSATSTRAGPATTWSPTTRSSSAGSTGDSASRIDGIEHRGRADPGALEGRSSELRCGRRSRPGVALGAPTGSPFPPPARRARALAAGGHERGGRCPHRRPRPAACPPPRSAATCTPSKPWRDTSSLAYPDFDLCAPLTEERRFDVVICEQVLEHVPDPGRRRRTCGSSARPGGHVIVSTPFLIKVHELPRTGCATTGASLRGACGPCSSAPASRSSRSVPGATAMRPRQPRRWSAHRRWHSLRNEPDVPVQVWAFARSPASRPWPEFRPLVPFAASRSFGAIVIRPAAPWPGWMRADRSPRSTTLAGAQPRARAIPARGAARSSRSATRPASRSPALGSADASFPEPDYAALHDRPLGGFRRGARPSRADAGAAAGGRCYATARLLVRSLLDRDDATAFAAEISSAR